MTWLLTLLAVYLVIGVPFAYWYWRDPSDADSIAERQKANQALDRVRKEQK